MISFKDYYVITPNIDIHFSKKKYFKSKFGEIGKFVEKEFEYSSGNNKKFLGIKEIIKLNKSNSIDDTL